MSRKRLLHDDEIAKELQALESSEDEEEIDNFCFGDTRLSIDANCGLDRIQSISYEELLETLESSVECDNQIQTNMVEVQHQVTEEPPSHQPHSTNNVQINDLEMNDVLSEPQTDVTSILEENEEYYSEMFQVYSGLQNKIPQWSNKVEHFREKVFEKDLKSLITV